MKNKKIKMILIFTIVLIIIDQVSKILVKNYFHESTTNNIINIRLIENTGMAFGINGGNTKNIILTSFILLIIFNFIRTQKELLDKKTSVAISLILSGGFSNLIDRIVRGGVVDFISIKNFPIFNIADCYIVIGWFLFILFLIKFNNEIIGEKNCEK